MNRSLTALFLIACAGTTAIAQTQGPSTLQTPYMVPAAPGVQFVSIISNGNGTATPNETHQLLGGTPGQTYRMAGIPDGLGAFRDADDIANGTFTLLMNHELGNSAGITRAHGSRGSFVSSWKINANPANLAVRGGKDLINSVNLWNTNSNSYNTFNASNPMPAYAQTPSNPGGFNPSNPNNPNNNGFNRFCSADLAAPTAFTYTDSSNTVFGTDARLFLTGEEAGPTGRAFAHVASGPNAGTAYELPMLGDFSWENAVASPYQQRKTIVIGTDDATPGNISVWVGEKQSSGNDIQRAGLSNGSLYTVTMNNTSVSSGQNIEDNTYVLGNSTVGRRESAAFGLHEVTDPANRTGADLQALDSVGQMNFLRPEDVSWDTTNPNRAYFSTTNSITSPTRLWAMDFTDVTRPELGGNVTMLLDGNDISSFAGGFFSSSGLSDVKMIDNITVSHTGMVLLQEDVGNNARLGRMWMYNPFADSILEIGLPDATRFLTGGTNYLGTQDEETSGIIDAWDILGPGWFLLDMQAHYAIGGELVEGGQLMAVYIPQTIPTPGAAALLALGTLFTARRNRR